MSGAEPFLLAAAVGISAVSAVAQGQQQSAIAKNNALLAERQADQIKAATALKEENYRRQLSRSIGAQRAAMGAAGIAIDGSALLALEETAAEGELDALTIRYSGSIQEADARAQAAADRMQAKAFRTNGFMSAASTLAFGAYNLSGYFPSGGGTVISPEATARASRPYIPGQGPTGL